MKAYEDDRYEKWRSATENTLPALLRKTLLAKKENSDELMVNWALELSEIILESKYLEQAGFQIPELARNMALQVRIEKCQISVGNSKSCSEI